jgi:hypothetical protein
VGTPANLLFLMTGLEEQQRVELPGGGGLLPQGALTLFMYTLPLQFLCLSPSVFLYLYARDMCR